VRTEPSRLMPARARSERAEPLQSDLAMKTRANCCRSAGAEGLAVIPYSPMARGFLTGKSRRDGSAPTERLRSDDYALQIYGCPNDTAVAEAVERVAAAQRVAPALVALAWTMSRPGVTAPIFGATRIEHVDAAAAALEISLGSEAIAAISQVYEPRSAVISVN
jgi:1-deoxyxylulose-5-phosphate synthase